MTYSKAKLKSYDDRASPCFKPFLIVNMSDKFLPTLRVLKLWSVITRIRLLTAHYIPFYSYIHHISSYLYLVSGLVSISVPVLPLIVSSVEFTLCSLPIPGLTTLIVAPVPEKWYKFPSVSSSVVKRVAFITRLPLTMCLCCCSSSLSASCSCYCWLLICLLLLAAFAPSSSSPPHHPQPFAPPNFFCFPSCLGDGKRCCCCSLRSSCWSATSSRCSLRCFSRIRSFVEHLLLWRTCSCEICCLGSTFYVIDWNC